MAIDFLQFEEREMNYVVDIWKDKTCILNDVFLMSVVCDKYYATYKSITFPGILFMFIEMKFIYFQSCVMFTMKSISIYND